MSAEHRNDLVKRLRNNPAELDKFMKDVYEHKDEDPSIIIVLLVDESGSMYNTAGDTVLGCNKFLDAQINSLKDKNVTLFINFFNTNRRSIYKGPLCNDSGPLYKAVLDEYNPGGLTKLFGSIMELAREVEEEIGHFKKAPTVVFTILTDGQDNQSGNITDSDVKAMIEKSGWEFLYLKEEKVKLEGPTIGINEKNVFTFNQCLKRSTSEGLYAAAMNMPWNVNRQSLRNSIVNKPFDTIPENIV